MKQATKNFSFNLLSRWARRSIAALVVVAGVIVAVPEVASATAISLSDSVSDTSVVGTTVVFRLTIAQNSSGSIAVTADISGTTTLCTVEVVTSTTNYTCSYKFLTVGSYSITATFTPSDSSPAVDPGTISPFLVTKASPVAILSNAVSNHAPLNQPVTFTATVTGVSGVDMSGNVTFYVSNALYGSCESVALTAGSGASSYIATATCIVTFTSSLGSPYHVQVSYSPSSNTNYNATLSSPLSFTIGSGAPSVIVSDSVGTSGTIGQSVRFTASVSGSSTTPTGTVTFYQSGYAVPTCLVVTLSSGIASCTITFSSFSGSPYLIQAGYSGDITYPSVAYSSSSGVSFDVNSSGATVKVTNAVSNVAALNVATVFTATVSGITGVTPTGTVTFYESGALIPACSTVTLHLGSATCTLTFSSLTSTPYIIQASYSGDANYNSLAYASSTGSSVTVGNALATVTVTDATSHVGSTGSASTFTATVTGNGGTPTGKVSFLLSGEAIAGCTNLTLVAGAAACSTVISSTEGNPYIIQASYSGDAIYNATAASSSVHDVFNVRSAPSLKVTDNVNKTGVVNVPFVISATVSGGSSPVGGKITIYQSGVAVPSCTALPVVSSEVFCQVTVGTVAATPLSYQASFTGDTVNASVAMAASTADLVKVAALPPVATVSFARYSRVLTPAAKKTLQILANRLQDGAILKVYGYAPGNGTLARQRINAVKAYLSNWVTVQTSLSINTETTSNTVRVVTLVD